MLQEAIVIGSGGPGSQLYQSYRTTGEDQLFGHGKLI
jgi:hypothetical protein